MFDSLLSFRRFRVAKKDVIRNAICNNNKIIKNIKSKENKIFKSLNIYKNVLQVGGSGDYDGQSCKSKASCNSINPKFKIALDQFLINRYFGSKDLNNYNITLNDMKEIISLHKFQRSFLRKQKFPRKLIIYDK